MKKYLTVFLVFSGLQCTFSQELTTKEKEVDEIIDELLMEDQDIDSIMASLTNFHFLYFSVNYNTNTYFSGRDIGIDQYDVRPQVTYMHSKGFFASVAGAYYSEFSPNWDFTSTTLGYGKSLGKKKLFRLHTAYTKYFYSEGVKNPFGNAVTVGLGIKNKQRSLGTQFSGSLLFGEDDSFQISSRSYIAFKLLKAKKASLTLRPQLIFVAGKQTFELAQTSVQNGILVTRYLENDVFALINTQVNLPLQFSSGSFDLELGYNLNLPSEIGTEEELPTTGFFNFSIAYLIGL